MNERVPAGERVAGAGRAGFDECLCSPRTPGPVVRDSVPVRAAAGLGRADRTGREMPHTSFNLMGRADRRRRPMEPGGTDSAVMTGGVRA